MALDDSTVGGLNATCRPGFSETTAHDAGSMRQGVVVTGCVNNKKVIFLKR
jgi:hypothetical protein